MSKATPKTGAQTADASAEKIRKESSEKKTAKTKKSK